MKPRSVLAGLAGLATLAAVVGGCASGDLQQTGQYRDDSGPVSWEIVGIRTNLSDDQRQITWKFTVILRETAGRGIQFEHIETSAQGGDHPDALMTGSEKTPFRVRLGPRAEYRYNADYGLVFTSTAGGGFGEIPGGRRGVQLRYRLTGRDETGQNVMVTIPVALHPGAGTQVRGLATPSEPVSPTVGPRAAAPAPPRTETLPSEAHSTNPARQAADECASRSTTLKVVGLDETGGVRIESRPGEEDDFLACYRSGLDARLRGRLVDVLGSPRRTTVPVDPLGASFVVVATIDSTHRARLLVDTGASMTILRPRLVERVEGAIEVEGLRRTIVVATGDRATVSLSRLRSLAIGGFEVEDLHVGVYDVIPQLPEIDGLLGTDFLHRFVVNIDGGTRQLTLEKLP